MRTISRRQVLQGAATVAGVQLLSPVVFRGSAALADVDPSTADRYRLILIDLFGGNDGLNTVVPKSGTIRTIYENVRLTTELAADTLNDLGAVDGGTVGLNPNLSVLHSLWQQNRVAIVQGVDYPNHDYSHFVSDDIWQSGYPDGRTDAGWLGRHLDRVGIGEGELRGISIGSDRVPLALQGDNYDGQQINSLGETQFSDGNYATYLTRRHEEFANYDAATGPLSGAYGDMCRNAYDLALATQGMSSAAPGGVSNHLLTARELLVANLGTEVMLVTTGGYDTHDNQLINHAALLRDLDLALEAFYFGTRDGAPILKNGVAIGPLPQQVAERTLVMTFSEFGRRIGDNGTGTDHGAAAPLFLIGPDAPAPGSGKPTLVPGLHRDHPSLGSVALPADNLYMTTDFRAVYQAVLTKWLAAPADPDLDVDGTGYETDGSLAGLFGSA